MIVTTYSIKDIENLTGIKAHTIRIWEQRYNIVSPQRTDTNIRYYDTDALKTMLNVALLNNLGYKISHIAKMGREEITRRVRESIYKASDFQTQINALSVAMIDLDEGQFDKIISTSVLQLGFEKTMLQIVYPFLVRVGLLWATSTINPAQEHFISNLIRQKVVVAIDGQSLAPKSPNAKSYMLYLPAEELHELSLLFATYIIKSRDGRVFYLGQSTPLQDVQETYNIHKPDFLLSVFTTHPNLDNVQAYIDTVSERFPNSKFIVSGNQVIGQDLRIPENVIVMNNLRDLIGFVEQNV